MTQESSQNRIDQTTEFLQLCLRSRFNPQLLDSVRKYVESHHLDWAVVEQRVKQERIAPLIYSAVREQELVPEILENQFKKRYFYNAIRNKLLLAELEQVTLLLNDGGVPSIVLKGAALSVLVYKNMALRFMRDMDLLIHKDHRPLAFQILDEAGYEPSDKCFLDRELAIGKEVQFSKGGVETVHLDLHWYLLNSNFHKENLPLDWFWQSASLSKSDNLPALVLCPEAQLLYLCGHLWLSNHAVDPMLLWLNDLVTLISVYQDRLDWDLLLKKTENCQLVYTVRHTLNKLAVEWDAPVPPDVLAKLQIMHPSSVELKIFTRHTIKRTRSRMIWDTLFDVPDRRQRLALALRWIFPAPASLRYRYGFSQPAALPLLYLYQCWRGLRFSLDMIWHYLSRSRRK